MRALVALSGRGPRRPLSPRSAATAHAPLDWAVDGGGSGGECAIGPGAGIGRVGGGGESKRQRLEAPTLIIIQPPPSLSPPPPLLSGRADATKEFDDFTLTASLTDATAKDFDAAPWMKDALITARTKKGKGRSEREARAHVWREKTVGTRASPSSSSFPSTLPSQTMSTSWSATMRARSPPWRA